MLIWAGQEKEIFICDTFRACAYDDVRARRNYLDRLFFLCAENGLSSHYSNREA